MKNFICFSAVLCIFMFRFITFISADNYWVVIFYILFYRNLCALNPDNLFSPLFTVEWSFSAALVVWLWIFWRIYVFFWLVDLLGPGWNICNCWMDCHDFFCRHSNFPHWWLSVTLAISCVSCYSHNRFSQQLLNISVNASFPFNWKLGITQSKCPVCVYHKNKWDSHQIQLHFVLSPV